MAILDADKYIRCDKCNSLEFKTEKRGAIKQNDNTLTHECYTAIICCECNHTQKKITKYDGCLFMERHR